MRGSLLTLILMLFFNMTAVANEFHLADKLKELCNEKLSIQVKYMPIFASSVQSIRDQNCSLEPNIAEVRDKLLLAMHKSTSEFRSIDGKLILKNQMPFELSSIQNVLTSMIANQGLPTVNLTRLDVNNLTFKMGSVLDKEIALEPCDGAIRTAFPDGSCMDFFKEYEALYNFALMTVSSPEALKVGELWEKAELDWNRYFDEGRSQMPWEYAANYALWSQTKHAGEVGTPLDYQLILFHPSVVIENFSNAIDGQNTKEGLMIEVLGINYWRSDYWYEPTGISVVNVYADRADTRDWGWGLALHFDNNLTFGMTRRSGENGFFISIDLWKTFIEKQEKLKEVRNHIVGN
ncbi:hypothetical protein [Flavobacterium sp.]|uniref:hypothetical protein n=1 Tax=Flavobacterium sp. TaxID=239 RepID=UPI0026354FE5|nr:hypothetical protein [Flavobacterium sp.]